jgi:integrase
MICGKPYKRGRIWWGKFRLSPADPITYFSTGCTDKQSAQTIIDQRVKEAQQEEAGIIAPKAQREAVNALLLDQVPEFITIQQSKGRDADYLYNVEKHLNRLTNDCAWKRPRDVTAVSFEAWRARQTLSPKTLNEYLSSANVFFKWMFKAGKMSHNPLATVERLNMKGVDRRERRALTQDELGKLVSVAGTQGVVYLVAAYTGLRRSELKNLEWRDVYLDVEKPYLSARASTTKNGRDAVLYLGPELVDALRSVMPADCEPNKKVFRGIMPGMKRLKTHLQSAGLPYQDERGKFADFHALRFTFVTRLGQSGVSPLIVKQAARHADIKQTMGYMDTSKLPVAEAMLGLPALGLSQGLSQKLVKLSPGESEPVKNRERPAASQSPESERFVPNFPALSGICNLQERVRSPGIEPGYAASETTILSVELRARSGLNLIIRMVQEAGQVSF